MPTTPLLLPTVVRIKPGALGRVGIYLGRRGHARPALLWSDGLPEAFTNTLLEGLAREGVAPIAQQGIAEGSFESAVTLLKAMPGGMDCIVGMGGGRALDVAKYLAFLAGKPYYSVPTSLSNDGFCSPQSSLTLEGKRRSMPSALPFGVVVDTAICQSAPRALWHSGVGDLAAKLTATTDWKLAFHHNGTPIDDFSLLLTDATVMQFIARPEPDLEGTRLLATALMLNGIAMQIAGSSRPASGSEHLLSHALDAISARPRLHGLQVGMATYLISRLQGGQHSERIADLFNRTGFWDTIRSDPFSREEWLAAARVAPDLKEDFHTILATRDCVPEIEKLLAEASHLAGCFTPLT